MYSKNNGITDRDYTLTPPPGYDGSRFRRRSDGRDDAFPLYGDRPQRDMTKRKDSESHEKCPDEPYLDCEDKDAENTSDCCEQCKARQEANESKAEAKADKSTALAAFTENLGGEELLLIALILILCRDSKAGIDTVLILALLLCIS